MMLNDLNVLIMNLNLFVYFTLWFRYNYDCVIYGWDSKCLATREWILQMGVNNLPKKDQQPFYNVLVADGSNRYAAQGNYVRCEFFHTLFNDDISYENICSQSPTKQETCGKHVSCFILLYSTRTFNMPFFGP